MHQNSHTHTSEQALLERIQERCATWIKELDSTHISEMYGAIHQGKMLRSKLMLAIAQDRQSAQEELISLCAIIELIQCASLLHDDVIDSATQRRSAPSVNALFGDKCAIMLGDVLYAHAFAKLCSFTPAIATCIANAVVKLSQGEIEDVAYAKGFQADATIYFRIIEQKTASLIAASAQSAALLMGLDDRAYYQYGHNLGIAFQIIDDILDITQSNETLGKPAMHDICEGKSTLPYILLYRALDAAREQEFLALFTRLSSMPKPQQKMQDIARIKHLLEQHNIIAQARHIAEGYIHSALESIAHARNSALESIAHALILRTH